MIKPTLCIQTGHQNNPYGATGTAGELDLVKKVFSELAPLLIKRGIVVYYDDYTCSNIKRLGDGLHYMIALHFDGSTNTSYNGGLIDVPPQCPNNGITPCDMHADESWKFAKKVADYYFNPMGIALRQEHRTKDTTYYEAFNYTGEKTKQFIIELGTLTNAGDRSKLQDFGKIARLLSEGILAYLSEFDANYKEYLAQNQAEQTSTEANELRKQLEAKNKLVKNLQTENKQLADEYKECQIQLKAVTERLDTVKKFVLTA